MGSMARGACKWEVGLALLIIAILTPSAWGQSLEEASRLNNQVVELYEQGRYREAIPLAQRALAIREKALEKDHPDVAQSLNKLAELYRALRDYSQAEPLYKRALAIVEKVHCGEDDADVVTILRNLQKNLGVEGIYRENSVWGETINLLRLGAEGRLDDAAKAKIKELGIALKRGETHNVIRLAFFIQGLIEQAKMHAFEKEKANLEELKVALDSEETAGKENIKNSNEKDRKGKLLRVYSFFKRYFRKEEKQDDQEDLEDLKKNLNQVRLALDELETYLAYLNWKEQNQELSMKEKKKKQELIKEIQNKLDLKNKLWIRKERTTGNLDNIKKEMDLNFEEKNIEIEIAKLKAELFKARSASQSPHKLKILKNQLKQECKELSRVLAKKEMRWVTLTIVDLILKGDFEGAREKTAEFLTKKSKLGIATDEEKHILRRLSRTAKGTPR